MTWTTARPTKAGWYWWRRSVGYHKALKVYSVAGSLCVAQGDDHLPVEEIDGGEWQGPIEPED